MLIGHSFSSQASARPNGALQLTAAFRSAALLAPLAGRILL